MTKLTKWHVRPAKTQISLGIRPDWSESSLSTWGKLMSLAIIRAHNEQRTLWSDWADSQADLSLSWAQRSFCWFCHEAAHFTLFHLHQQYWFLLFRGVLFPETPRESYGFCVSMHMLVSVYYVILQASGNTHLYLSHLSTCLTVRIALGSQPKGRRKGDIFGERLRGHLQE